MTATTNNILKLLCVAALCTSFDTVSGAKLQSVEVWMKDGRYHLVSETLLNAKQDELYEVLTDYEQFKKFSSAIVDSQNVKPDFIGRPRFYTRMRGCVLLYCHTFDRRGYLILQPKYDITAVADPERSDFKFSRERWRLSRHGDHTMMTYEFEVEPRFWVPPYVGPYVIKRALKSGSIRAVNRIEALARGEEPNY